MLDRWGYYIRVGWAPHHIEWLEAAMTLHGTTRQFAFRDIADMTGRSIKAVSDKASKLRHDRSRAALRAEDLARSTSEQQRRVA